MNNKGFAITGIIYTLFIIFLLILLSVLSNLSSYQRLMINSTESLEDSFTGKKIENAELDEIKGNGQAPYLGKYIFKLDTNRDGIFNDEDDDILCSAYLDKGTSFDDENIFLSPRDCNDYDASIELIEVYSFEEES